MFQELGSEYRRPGTVFLRPDRWRSTLRKIACLALRKLQRDEGQLALERLARTSPHLLADIGVPTHEREMLAAAVAEPAKPFGSRFDRPHVI